MEKETQEERGRLNNKKPSPECQQCAVQKKKKTKKKTKKKKKQKKKTKKKKKPYKIGENGNSNVPSLGFRAGSETA